MMGIRGGVFLLILLLFFIVSGSKGKLGALSHKINQE
jgi:hypothetical protein